MSYFSSKLSEFMEVKKMRGADLARLSGLSEVKISRWLNDKQTTVSPEDLEALCVAFTHNRAQQAELLCAHLLDECQGPGAELIKIRIHGDREPHVLNDSGETPLPPRLERAFKVLRDHIHDPDLRTVLLGLADLLDKPAPEKKLSRGVSIPAVYPAHKINES